VEDTTMINHPFQKNAYRTCKHVPIYIQLIVLFLLISTGSAQITTKVMPLGNSITRGGGSTGEVGYRRPLYLLLKQSGYQIDFVGSQVHGTYTDFDREHEGHGSYRADQLRDNIISWLDDHPADIILLHIGINDIAGGNEDPQEVDDLLDNIDLWESDNSRPITVIVTRIINWHDGNDPVVTAFNDSVEIIVQQRILAGDDLIWVDMEHAIIYPDDLYDGVHPNDIGYSKMANVWYNTMITLLPEPDTLYPLITIDNVTAQPSTQFNNEYDSVYCEYDLSGLSTGANILWFRNGEGLTTFYSPFEGGTQYSLLNLSSPTDELSIYRAICLILTKIPSS